MTNYDKWLLSGSDFDDVCDYYGDVVFSMKLRGGSVKVSGSVTKEYEGDENGRSSFLAGKINSCTWAFCDCAEVDLDEQEKEEVKKTILKEINL